MECNEIQKRILERVDGYADQLIKIGNSLYSQGEPGYREFSTARLIKEMLESYGLPVTGGLALTGLRGTLRGEGKNNGGVQVAVLGELDGIACPKHPSANPVNGISHACGHHTQLTMLLGTAMALSDPQVRCALDGNVAFLGIPSEEYTDLEYKDQLKKEGKICYGGGKSEFVRLGVFDDISVTLNHHLHMVDSNEDVLLGNNTTNGFVLKKVTFHGKASHAAISPHLGINALNAASIGLNALAYQRETYREADYVRVHAMITKGGNMVNVVPDDVELETQVRAKTMPAMLDACMKTDRAFQAGAYAVGASVSVQNYPGYLPVLASPVPEVLKETGRLLQKEYSVRPINPLLHNCASTDVGDLTHLMPVVGFTTGGFSGSLHGANFRITDPYMAYVLPAKVMALTVYGLLRNGAFQARELREQYPVHLTKEEYLRYMDGGNLLQPSTL